MAKLYTSAAIVGMDLWDKTSGAVQNSSLAHSVTPISTLTQFFRCSLAILSASQPLTCTYTEIR